MATDMTSSHSVLLEYLPAIYHEHEFLGQFLLAFEKVLFGREDGIGYKDDALVGPDEKPDRDYRGLEDIVANLALFFDPQETRTEFLPWLAKWIAFSWREDIDEQKQRNLMANMVELYRWRGTKKGLLRLLEMFELDAPMVVDEGPPEFQIAVHSTIGQDTYLGGGPPHFFRVSISLQEDVAPEIKRARIKIARALIDLEKPAHTTCRLEAVFPAMQIGVHSTVGIDTLIGYGMTQIQNAQQRTVSDGRN